MENRNRLESVGHRTILRNRISTACFCLFAILFPDRSVAQDVNYFAVFDRSETGIGFPGGGESLYVGGCRTFNLLEKRFEGKCIYPAAIRWAAMSPDGSRLLATVISKDGQKAKSLQIDALTGKILTARPGVYFSPPVAIDPLNRFWIAVQAGLLDRGSEMLVVTPMDQWKPSVPPVYTGAHRVFSLLFTREGRELMVNGGPPTGSTLDTASWSIKDVDSQVGSAPGAILSHDERFQATVLSDGIQLERRDTGEALVKAELDMTREAPQLAFSWDGKWFAAKGYRFAGSGSQGRYSFVLIRLPD